MDILGLSPVPALAAP